MNIRNDILKFATSWEAQDPSSFDVSLEWSSPYPGLRWKLVNWEGLENVAVIADCEPGLEFPYHLHHDHDEVFVVLEKSFTLEIVKTEHFLKAGDSIVVPKGTLHRGFFPDGARVMFMFKK